MLRLLVLLAIIFIGFTSLHWTQRFDHAIVFTRFGCLPGFASGSTGPDPGASTECVYRDVTLDTRFLTREYVLVDGQEKAYLPADTVTSMAFSSDQSPFTWRTYLVLAAFIALMLGMLATDPDLWRLLKTERHRK